LLVTSREPLHVSGEQEYAVLPLVHEEGVGFFLARARAINPDFQVDGAVSEVCRRLDDLPLALELAAARVKALSTTQILERLDERLPLLTGGARDLPERQRTLRATIEWSNELLTPEEQRLFSQLAVFVGGCTFEAAEEVCDADLNTLQSLVEKSLVRFTQERYWMLETIREFAGERLDRSDEASELERRHAHWYRELSERYERELRGPTGARWYVRIEAELDNIRSAASWGLEHDAELAFALVVNTSYFWSRTGRTLEAKRLLDATWTDDVPIELKKRALKAMSTAAMDVNDFETVMSISKQRLDLARESGDLDQEAAAMGMLAAGSAGAGDSEKARYWYETALVARRSTESAAGLKIALFNFGRFERHQGNLTRSRELLEEFLAIARAQDDELDVAYGVKELAMTATEAGAFGEAIDLLSEGFDIASRLGLDVIVAGDLVFAVALLAARTERPRQGAVLFGAVDAHDERIGFAHIPELTWWWTLRDELAVALGDSSFDAAFAEGRALSLDAAVEEALTVID
jgi:tetratricopeptide (TPR) repeat protein